MCSTWQTNNPRKIKEMSLLGLNITGRVPCIVEQPNEFNLVRVEEVHRN